MHRVMKVSSGKTYALKVIPSAGMRHTKRVDFATEVLVHRGLHHPNIVNLHEVFRDAGNYYIAMEMYVDGACVCMCVCVCERERERERVMPR